jgi:hypothetical protein
VLVQRQQRRVRGDVVGADRVVGHRHRVPQPVGDGEAEHQLRQRRDALQDLGGAQRDRAAHRVRDVQLGAHPRERRAAVGGGGRQHERLEPLLTQEGHQKSGQPGGLRDEQH